jgi:hypothetical protein
VHTLGTKQSSLKMQSMLKCNLLFFHVYISDNRLRAEKGLKEPVGLGMPISEAQFMVTSKAANMVY